MARIHSPRLRYFTDPGGRIAFRDSGTGIPVVMIHGALGSSRVFADVIPLLKAWARVIAPDLRGMGQSGRTASMPSTAWTDDLGWLLDTLEIPSIHLVGSSLGARIAMRFTLLHPDRVSSLTLDAPMLGVTPQGDAALVAAFSNPAPSMIADFAAWQGDDWPLVVQNFLHIRQISGLQDHLSVTPTDLAEIRCPVLVTRGDFDEPIHPLDAALTIYRTIKGTKLWIAPNTKAPALRLRPKRFAEIYREFIDQLG